MLIPGNGAPETAIERWMAAWFDLLGQGRLAEAIEQLDLPGGDGAGWTPERLIAVIEDHFGPGTYFRWFHPEGPRLTPATTATGAAGAYVVALADGSGYKARHSVPLNGEFSDLVADFDFRWSGAALLVALYDLLVP